MNQGGPHSRSTTFEPLPPSTAEQSPPHSQAYTQGLTYVMTPFGATTRYIQPEHWAAFNLEEQYRPSTASKKRKEKDETSTQIAKFVIELELMKGGQFPISMDFEDLCIHPRGVLTRNIQMPNMEKYDGTTCPRMHLRMYCNAMFQWRHNEHILVQMFGQSLEKNAGKWLASQKKSYISTWRALIRSFLSHYRFNLELLPTREEVEGMRPASGESIRDFAYRWRLKTSNLKHPMSEEDMISTFKRMLGPTYQLMLLTTLQNNFVKVVNKAVKVELAIKAGLVPNTPLTLANSTKSTPKKASLTWLEANLMQAIKVLWPNQNSDHVCLHRSRLRATLRPWISSLLKHSSFTNPDTRVCPKKRKRKGSSLLCPTPTSISEYLIKKKLLQLIEPRPPPYPLPYRYNQVDRCEYHQTLGHTLNRCFYLKHDIQDLIDEGKVSVDPSLTNPPSNTNIIQNPLPDH